MQIKISAWNFETAVRQLFSSCAATQPHSLEGMLILTHVKNEKNAEMEVKIKEKVYTIYVHI